MMNQRKLSLLIAFSSDVELVPLSSNSAHIEVSIEEHPGGLNAIVEPFCS